MRSSIGQNQEAERMCIDLDNSGGSTESIPTVSVENCIESNERSFREEQFDEFLVQAIDEAITSLGEPVKNTVYQHLEVDFCMTKNDIPKRIAEFTEIMHKIFGLGASRLEIKFMKNLCLRIQNDAKWPEHECLSKWIVMEVSFEQYIDKMRKNYITQTPKTH